MLGRIHSYEDFLESYDAARKAGFENINVDVMSALPAQTVISYEITLKNVLRDVYKRQTKKWTAP